ncbi:MAG: hypothetical protein D6725_00230 [Planctomycetota bacterium]|nr:MAG: hypothetical protein D6725_00230 [Planctomycetota bacterium]
MTRNNRDERKRRRTARRSGGKRRAPAARDAVRGAVGWFLAAAVVSFPGSACSASAAEHPETAAGERGGCRIAAVRVGLDGTAQVGRWTAVRVTVEVRGAAAAGTVRGEVETLDPVGRTVIYPSASRPLQEGTTELSWSFLPGRLDAVVRVRVLWEHPDGLRPVGESTLVPSVSAGGDSAAGSDDGSPRFTVVPQSEVLWATLGPLPGFDELSAEELRLGNTGGGAAGSAERPRRGDRDGERRRRVIVLSELPADAAALEAVRTLVLAGAFASDAERSAALREWVFSGGHLVLIVGDAVEAFRSSPLAAWVPVDVGETVKRLPDTRLSALESLAGRAQRILFSGRIPVAELSSSSGTVLADSLDGPLVVRAPYGMGLVTAVAVDIRKPPLLGWKGLATLCEKLGEPRWSVFREAGETRRRAPRRITRTGISELGTQLHVWLERFPEVRRPGTWTSLGLMVLYLAFIGPLDYLVVHRWLKRPHWTWFTLPVLVTVWAVSVAWVARAANGVDAGLNTIAVWDIDAATGRGRTQQWCAMYSERSHRAEVAVSPPPIAAASAKQDVPRPRLRWDAVAENAFGGMYRPSGIELFHAAYRFSPRHDRLLEVPMLKWSTFCWRSQWSGAVRSGLVEARLSGRGVGRLSGTVRHNLPGPVRDWILAYQGRVYWPRVDVRTGRLPAWEPGDPINLDSPRIVDRELRGYLTGTVKRRILKDGGVSELRFTEQKPYPVIPEDLVEVMRILTFHEAAGGKSYTRLNNYAYDALDLSGLLDHRRAVLFGVLDADAPAARIDGSAVAAARQYTFVRLVLPVRQQAETPRTLLPVR